MAAAKSDLMAGEVNVERKPHHVAMIFVVAREGVLYLKRAINDDIEGGKWGIICGHVDKGERPSHTARRELAEEAGLDHLHGRLEHLGTLKATTWRTPPDGERSLIHANVEVFCLVDYNLRSTDIRISNEHTAAQFVGIDRFFGLREENRQLEIKAMARGGRNGNAYELRLTLADQQIIQSPIFDTLKGKIETARNGQRLRRSIA